jgi:hypothetical protein
MGWLYQEAQRGAFRGCLGAHARRGSTGDRHFITRTRLARLVATKLLAEAHEVTIRHTKIQWFATALGRPFGQMSSFHLAVAMVLVLAALAMLITVLYLLR